MKLDHQYWCATCQVGLTCCDKSKLAHFDRAHAEHELVYTTEWIVFDADRRAAQQHLDLG